MHSFSAPGANSLLHVPVDLFYNHCGIVRLLHVNQLKHHLIKYEPRPPTDLSSECVFKEGLACKQVCASNLQFRRDSSLAIHRDVFRPSPKYLFGNERSSTSSCEHCC